MTGAADRPDGSALRDLPSVDRLATAVARAELNERRAAIQRGERPAGDPVSGARARLRPSLRRVLNATGVVLHTNLGRAPLPAAAQRAVAEIAAGYSNLEHDLGDGERGSRQGHVRALLCELTGAEDALVVNNCAAATLLALAATVPPGDEVVVSRGQLVEIGGGFRVPDVVRQGGARLVEVGATNRTRLEDYRRAIGPETGAVLRVHPSNYRVVGFTEAVEVEVLAELGPPLIDDVGAGVIDDSLESLADEPPVRRSVRAGAALVAFSGDKLLGGPQAGLLVGRADAVAACRAHPLARAVRVDKLSLAALEATLRIHRDPELARRELPVLAMLELDAGELRRRADRLAGAVGGTVIESSARVGGGALPLLELAGHAVAIDPGGQGSEALATALRAGDPPLIGLVRGGRVVLDPRTLTEAEIDEAIAAVRAARA